MSPVGIQLQGLTQSGAFRTFASQLADVAGLREEQRWPLTVPRASWAETGGFHCATMLAAPHTVTDKPAFPRNAPAFAPSMAHTPRESLRAGATFSTGVLLKRVTYHWFRTSCDYIHLHGVATPVARALQYEKFKNGGRRHFVVARTCATRGSIASGRLVCALVRGSSVIAGTGSDATRAILGDIGRDARATAAIATNTTRAVRERTKLASARPPVHSRWRVTRKKC